MLGHPEFILDDYLAILRRRVWLIAIPLVVGSLAGYGISLLITPRYTSQSLILIEQPRVPENFVQSVVTTDLFERLTAMEGQILSRTRLQPIIERYGLYHDEAQLGTPMEDLVDEMRQGIAVEVVQDFSAQSTAPQSFFAKLFSIGSTKKAAPPTPPPTNKKGQEAVAGFSISFTTDKPRLAQQVCTDITAMFMQENTKQREQSAQGTTDFLSSQLDAAKRQLDEQDKKLAEFKRRNFGALPEDQQANLQLLTTFNTQLGTVTELMSRAEQDRAYAESLLAQQLAAWQASSSALNPQDPQTLQKQINTLKETLGVLEGRYTADHPDIIKLKTNIAQLEKQLAELAAAGPKAAGAKPAEKNVEPAQLQQLRAQVHQAEQTIRIRTQEQDHLRKQIELYQARIQMTPLVEEQFKDLTRDYQTALKFYDDLLAKRNQSQMSTDLEHRQQGEQFQVLDAATLPDTPSFPDRLLFALGGLGGGLGLGFLLALLVEMRDKSLRTDRDVKHYLGLPTLVMVPTLESGENAPPSFWRRWGKGRKVAAGQAA